MDRTKIGNILLDPAPDHHWDGPLYENLKEMFVFLKEKI